MLFWLVATAAFAAGTEEPIVLGEVRWDVDGDGRSDRIVIRLVSPRVVPWMATERLEGKLVVTVKRASGQRTDTDISALIGRDVAVYDFQDGSVVVRDYNHDGRLDFNVGQQCADGA